MSDTVSSYEGIDSSIRDFGIPNFYSISDTPDLDVAPDLDAAPYVIAAMPAFNEELYIAKIILGAQELVDRVIVVDDGSSDETATIAERMGATVIRHEENLGYGAALKTIFEVARAMDVDALVVLDSDGQHTPRDIGRVLDPVLRGKADVVVGSRFLKNTKHDHIPRYRMVGMMVLDTATTLAGGIPVTDTQSGFRAYGRQAIDAVHLNGSGMSAGSEILIQVSDHNLKIAEVPIDVRYDIENTSTHHPIAHGGLVLYNLLNLISYRRPIITFTGPGCFLVAFGFGACFVAYSEYYAAHQFPFGMTMVSVVSLIMGLLLITTGLILNATIHIVGNGRQTCGSH